MSFIKNILPSTRLRIFRLHADVVLRPVSVYWMDFLWVMEKEKSAASRLSPCAESWKIIEPLLRISKELWSLWNGWRMVNNTDSVKFRKDGSDFLDYLKIMAKFATILRN